MDKQMAEYCDIVMNHLYGRERYVSYANPAVSPELISEINWKRAIDTIKGGFRFIMSPDGQPYTVFLNPSGRAFVGNGGSFVALFEENQLKDKTENNRIKLQDKKIDLDIEQAKRQVKWFYPLLMISFIGAIGSIAGIYSIFQTQSVESRLKIIDKSISHFYQKETDDSIRAVQIQIRK